MGKTLLEVFSGDEARMTRFRISLTVLSKDKPRTGICPLCDGLGKLSLAVEVKSFIKKMPMWLERGVSQSEKAAVQTGKTGVVIVTWKDKGVRRYFLMSELQKKEEPEGSSGSQLEGMS